MENIDFRGAESKLFRKDWLDLPALYKVRIPKTYRIKELDFQFRKQRTIHEARLLSKAKDVGVRVPIIYEIDIQNTTLVLEYLEGEILKTLLPKLDKNACFKISEKIGCFIGILHKNGIIHGDLTTSNIISFQNQIAFIDFGLGYISERLEDIGIDIYLLEKAIKSTHIELFDKMWEAILLGYKRESPFGEVIEAKIDEIISRGRYSDRV
ncbi:MAG: Kae1-associated serine/threonine protein kinase [Candidatus Heimdallarchaeota archaeon]|nr:Kae1-associated serine/threonine protein kinase [Candidatus Heimdallarchaeota archaeon]